MIGKVQGLWSSSRGAVCFSGRELCKAKSSAGVSRAKSRAVRGAEQSEELYEGVMSKVKGCVRRDEQGVTE